MDSAALARYSGQAPGPSGVPRGVIFLTGAMGRVRDYNADKVCKVLGEPLLAIYDQGNKVPKRLPNAAFAVLLVSAAGHDLQDQVAKRKQPGTRVLRVSHKWAVAEAQLRAIGLFGPAGVAESLPMEEGDVSVDVSGGKVPVSRFATVPFLVRLMRRYPKFTGVDLVVLRHSGLSTPVRASKSLAALITACQEALREIGSPGPFIQRTTPPVAPLDKWLEAAKACLKSEERVEPSSEVAGRIAFIDSWAGAVSAIPKDSSDWSKIAKGVAEVIDVPGWNVRFDTIEFRLLCHAWGMKRGGTTQDVIDAAKAVSASLTASRTIRVDKPVVVTPAPSVTSAVALPAASVAVTNSGGEFFPSLFRALPALSLADCAWLRQQPEVWPARACPWLTCYALYSNGAKGVDASAKQRAVSDDALLEAAYSLVSSGSAPGEPAEWAREFRVLAALVTHIKFHKAGVVDPAPLGALLSATEAWGWHFREGAASELLYLLGEAEAGSGLLYSQRGWGAAVIGALRKVRDMESAPAPQVPVSKKVPVLPLLPVVPVSILEEDMPESARVQPASAASVERVPVVVPLSGTSESDGKDFRAALRRVFPGVSKLMEVYGVKSLTFGAGGKASWERERIIVQRETGEESLVDE